MIPTNTLRERMREAMLAKIGMMFGESGKGLSEKVAFELADAAIDAIGDPVLVKMADTKEPWFVLRAQDIAAAYALEEWLDYAREPGDTPESKLADAERHLSAFEDWPTRKWPD